MPEYLEILRKDEHDPIMKITKYEADYIARDYFLVCKMQ